MSRRRPHPGRAAAAGAALALAAALLGACGSRAPAPADTRAGAPAEPTAAPAATAEAHAAFVGRQRERALRAAREGRWADAALAWDAAALLLSVAPAAGDAREAQAGAEDARRRAQAVAAERLAAGQAAQRRGDWEPATLAYLEALAADPRQPAAADALRQLERDRARRSVAGRFARAPVGPAAPRRPAAAERGTMAEAMPAARAAAPAGTNLREHATLLVRQGELDAAIALLRDAPAAARAEPPTRALLADLHVAKADAQWKAQQADAARASLGAALALERMHAGALALRAQMGEGSAAGAASAAASAAAPRSPARKR